MAFSFRARDDAHSPKPKQLPWKDYAPPEAQHADRAIEALKLAQHVVASNTRGVDRNEPESEVMPLVSEQRTSAHDTRPPSAMGAKQLKPLSSLEAIAIDISGLPYGEFMELAEGVGAEPDTLWKWATTAVIAADVA